MVEINQVNLIPLLNKARNGALVIPDFQRDFIWQLKQIEELLNSVINGYFVGSILLLESPLANQRFAPRLLRGVQQSQVNLTNENTIRFILDGQQRVTSLFYAFFEPDVPLSDELNFVCKFYIRPDNMDIFGLIDPEDIARRLRLGADLKKQLYDIYYNQYGVDIKNLPSMSVFRNEEAFNHYIDSNPSLTHSFRERLCNLFDKIQAYKIPVITLPSNTLDEDIVNTFERINRTGTPLSIFELAVARYYPLRINLNTLKNKIKHQPFLEILDEVSVLKVMAIFKDLEPKSQNLLRLVDIQNNKNKVQILTEFYNLWDRAVNYLGRALDRIRHIYGAGKIKIGKRTIDLIPYTSMIVPLAVLLYEIERLGNQSALYEKLDFWYWANIFAQKYTHGTDSKSFNDVRELRNLFSNSTKKPDFIPNFDHVRSEMLKSARSSALGKAFYNQLILSDCRDLLTGQTLTISECQVDHIFPSSQFGRVADNIFNLTLLDKNTNQRKKDKLPVDFISECLVSHGNDINNLMRTLETHFISKEAYEAIKTNNLDAFIQARADGFICVLKRKLSGD